MSSGTTASSGIKSVSRPLLALALVLLLLIIAATVQQMFAVRAAILRDAENQMSRLDMVFAEQTGRAVETVDVILRDAIETLQHLRSASRVNTDAYNDFLRRRIEGVRQITAMAITDADGNVIYSTPLAPRVLSPDAREMLQGQAEHPEPALRFSKPMRAPDGKWTALMVRDILGPDGKFAGLAIAALNLFYFEDFYKAVELTENGAILLHLRDGTVLARYPHNDTIVGQSYADLPPFKDILAHSMAGTVVMDSPLDGRHRVLAIRALKAFPLAVNISVQEDKVLAAWRNQTWYFLVIAIVAMSAIIALLLLLARRSVSVERMNAELREQMAERERAEAALRQAQRVEAVGQLTGGVAHDFNNLLTVLIGNIDLLQSSEPQDLRTRDRLIAMRAAAEKGATLTGHLLAFARRQPLVPRAVDLNGMVNGMRDLLQSALGRRVRMQTRLASDLWSAMVDPTQIELVILNLAINARDAIPESGVVTIETTNRHCSLPTYPEHPSEGDYVVVTVRDTGVGMTPEVQAKAFEPFFTTKGPGSGSGLGLSQVFGTARQSGGDVQIESEVGKGTAVSVFLPRATVAVERPVPAPVVTEDSRGSATVLLVDDDDAVRATTADVLGGLGYGVKQAADGLAALELLNTDSAIDLLLTDVVMPGMSGPELARRVSSTRPNLPIIFISGYADPEGLAGDSLGRLVRKPFRAAELQEQIEEAIDQARAAPVV
jgi:signal transduction histidine kinase